MIQQNSNSWNEKWQVQMDKAHSDLLELNNLREAAERYLAHVNLNIKLQIALMELIDSQIKPKAPRMIGVLGSRGSHPLIVAGKVR